MVTMVFAGNLHPVCGQESRALPNGNVLIDTLGSLLFYEAEQGHGLSIMQFQLAGIISSVQKAEGAIILFFTGVIELTGNGGGPFSEIQNLRTDKWIVTELPVRIDEWDESAEKWAARTLTFDQTFAVAGSLAKDAKTVKVALKALSMKFTDAGSVLSIGAEQAIFKEVKQGANP